MADAFHKHSEVVSSDRLAYGHDGACAAEFIILRSFIGSAAPRQMIVDGCGNSKPRKFVGETVHSERKDVHEATEKVNTCIRLRSGCLSEGRGRQAQDQHESTTGSRNCRYHLCDGGWLPATPAGFVQMRHRTPQ